MPRSKRTRFRDTPPHFHTTKAPPPSRSKFVVSISHNSDTSEDEEDTSKRPRFDTRQTDIESAEISKFLQIQRQKSVAMKSVPKQPSASSVPSGTHDHVRSARFVPNFQVKERMYTENNAHKSKWGATKSLPSKPVVLQKNEEYLKLQRTIDLMEQKKALNEKILLHEKKKKASMLDAMQTSTLSASSTVANSRSHSPMSITSSKDEVVVISQNPQSSSEVEVPTDINRLAQIESGVQHRHESLLKSKIFKIEEQHRAQQTFCHDLANIIQETEKELDNMIDDHNAALGLLDAQATDLKSLRKEMLRIKMKSAMSAMSAASTTQQQQQHPSTRSPVSTTDAIQSQGFTSTHPRDSTRRQTPTTTTHPHGATPTHTTTIPTTSIPTTSIPTTSIPTPRTAVRHIHDDDAHQHLTLLNHATNSHATNNHATNNHSTNNHATNSYPTNNHPTNNYATNNYSTNNHPTNNNPTNNTARVDERSQQPKVWSCASCQSENPSSQTKCWACDVINPHSNTDTSLRKTGNRNNDTVLTAPPLSKPGSKLPSSPLTKSIAGNDVVAINKSTRNIASFDPNLNTNTNPNPVSDSTDDTNATANNTGKIKWTKGKSNKKRRTTTNQTNTYTSNARAIATSSNHIKGALALSSDTSPQKHSTDADDAVAVAVAGGTVDVAVDINHIDINMTDDDMVECQDPLVTLGESVREILAAAIHPSVAVTTATPQQHQHQQQQQQQQQQQRSHFQDKFESAAKEYLPVMATHALSSEFAGGLSQNRKSASEKPQAPLSQLQLSNLLPKTKKNVSTPKANFSSRYSSVLKAFKVLHRVPEIRDTLKIPKDSNFYLNQINPEIVVCRYSLHGVCNETQCKFQHANAFDVTTTTMDAQRNHTASDKLRNAATIFKPMEIEQENRKQQQRYFSHATKAEWYEKETARFDQAHLTHPHKISLWLEHVVLIFSEHHKDLTSSIQIEGGGDNEDDATQFTNIAHQHTLHILATALELNRTNTTLWFAYLSVLVESGASAVTVREYSTQACKFVMSFAVLRFCRNSQSTLIDQLRISATAYDYVRLSVESDNDKSAQMLELLLAAMELMIVSGMVTDAITFLDRILNDEDVSHTEDQPHEVFAPLDALTFMLAKDISMLWLCRIHMEVFSELPSTLFNRGGASWPGALLELTNLVIPWERVSKLPSVVESVTPLFRKALFSNTYARDVAVIVMCLTQLKQLIDVPLDITQDDLGSQLQTPAHFIAWGRYIASSTETLITPIKIFLSIRERFELSAHSDEVLLVMLNTYSSRGHADSWEQEKFAIFAAFLAKRFDLPTTNSSDSELAKFTSIGHLAEIFDQAMINPDFAVVVDETTTHEHEHMEQSMNLLARAAIGMTNPYNTRTPHRNQLAPGKTVDFFLLALAIIKGTSTTLTEVINSFEHVIQQQTHVESKKRIWDEYFTFRLETIGAGDTCVGLEELLKRCLTSVSTHARFAVTNSEKDICDLCKIAPATDVTFHNRVIEKFSSFFPQTQSLDLQIACLRLFKHANVELVVRTVSRLFLLKAFSVASNILASAIYNSPRTLVFWRLATFIELHLGKIVEARWLLTVARKHLPKSLELLHDVRVICSFARSSVFRWFFDYFSLSLSLSPLSLPRSLSLSLSPSLSLSLPSSLSLSHTLSLFLSLSLSLTVSLLFSFFVHSFILSLFVSFLFSFFFLLLRFFISSPSYFRFSFSLFSLG